MWHSDNITGNGRRESLAMSPELPSLVEIDQRRGDRTTESVQPFREFHHPSAPSWILGEGHAQPTISQTQEAEIAASSYSRCGSGGDLLLLLSRAVMKQISSNRSCFDDDEKGVRTSPPTEEVVL